MPPPAPSSPDLPEDDARWRTAGDRIQTLLDASSAGGAAARERAEQLAAEVTDLYGAALERIAGLALSADADLADAFAADDLVASLLLVHGLHPHTVERRIADALEGVRPYLGSHGGDVHLLGVDGGIVRLQFAGSCKSCPSSAVTLELAVEDAVRTAAPEVTSIEVVAAAQDSAPDVIPAEQLLRRVHRDGHGSPGWHAVPELAELSPGEVGGFLVAGTVVLACRIGSDILGYRDRCPACTDSMAGAALHDNVLTCPQCDTDFDVVHAGHQIDGGLHLEPIPVLLRGGVLSMALPKSAAQEVA